MTKKRFLLALALMLTAVGGAWAQGEVLLTTINSNENTGFTSGSQSFDGVATVTFSQSVNNDGDGWGWYRGNETTITVTAANNDVTITKVKFYCSEGSAFDEEAPFEAIVKYEGGDNIAKVNGTSIGRYGVTKIEVYGTEPLLNWDAATRTGSLTVPAGNVTLTVDYYGQYTLDSVPTAEGWQVKVNGTLATVTPYTPGSALGHVDNINETDSVELVPPAALRETIKSVTLVEPTPTLDLATVTTDITVEDGYTVTGTLGANVKISIAEGATVTLDGVTINGVNNGSYEWAGITCLGDATIILSGMDTVKGFHRYYPGIYVPQNKTLTIEGSGSLTASSNGYACGIGSGYQIACGNIVIAGGTITANGGQYAAGIGSGYNVSCGNISITGGTINATSNLSGAGIGSGGMGSCGDISITGGTITANGGYNSAGIGSGYYGSCGTVTITNGVTSVTATKGNSAPYSIGAGNNGQCGTVTVGGNTGAIETSPYTYPQN